MITLHATKKLFAKLPVDAEGALAAVPPSVAAGNAQLPNPLSGWHGNLLVLQRRQCVLLVHDATRFPVFMTSLVKADFAHFNVRFADALMNTLLKAGADECHMQAAVALLAPVQVDTTCNRSVQGTMNQMAGDIEHLLWYEQLALDDLSDCRTGAWLADRPTRVKGHKDYLWPCREMLALLETASAPARPAGPVAAAPATAPVADKVVSLADYRDSSRR
ncbi:MAG: DUF6933 domain-containing protein [Moraxellaceae bacterium]